MDDEDPSAGAILSALRQATMANRHKADPLPPASASDPDSGGPSPPSETAPDLFSIAAPDTPPQNPTDTAQPPAPSAKRRTASSVNPDLVSGHRARLRKRFDGGETLADYELLELVLFRAIARRDTKPIAKAMMARFGSFAGAVSASADELATIEGVGQRVISDLKLVRAAAERFAEAALQDRAALTSTDAVAAYYRAKLQGAKREEFHILFLDKKNGMLASECAGVGTVDHTPVYPREVVVKALQHGATGLVLIHNHPSGDPTPSRADVEMTRQIVDATATVGVKVFDHIILGGAGHTSLRGEGLM